MEIHNFHPETGEFIGQGQATPSPLEEDVWGVPAFATTVAPPSKQAGKARVWANDAWTHVLDHRGEIWWDANGNPVEIEALGDPTAQGLSNVEPPPPAPTGEMVNVERERRKSEGAVFMLTGYPTPIHVQGRPSDMDHIKGLYLIAKERIDAGDTTTLSVFRCKGNQNHMLTPPQMVELFQKGSAFISAIMAKSWELKDNPPIQPGFDDDATWPSVDQTAMQLGA